MAGGIVFCADIGTSSLKASLIDSNGHQRAFIRQPYARGRGVPAEAWETALSLAVRALRSQAPELEPALVCISGNGPTLVPVSFRGEAFDPLYWYGNRVDADGADAGGQAARSFFLPHAAWFRQERPEWYENTRYFFSSQEWLSFRLGGEMVTVLPSAGYEPYYWDDAQCGIFGIDRAKFPPFVMLGSVIGRVSPPAERQFALPRVPIVAGGPDFIMALIGVGAVRPGIVCDRAGTSEGINICSSAPVWTDELRVLPHLEEGLWNVGAVIPASGRIFDWFRALTGQEDRSYDTIIEEIAGETEPGRPDAWGSAVQPPLFYPPFYEKTPALLLASGLPGRAVFGRGMVESIGFQVRAALDTLNRHGFPVEAMRLSGGQGRCRRWNQLKADISGCALLALEIADGELAGNAALASLVLGEASDLAEAAGRMVRIRERFTPDPRTLDVYRDKYQVYREWYGKIGELFGVPPIN
jgi:sugar (pentulose or hexulose) kinase